MSTTRNQHADPPGTRNGGPNDIRQRLNQFFASVERRAFRMAQIATGHHEDALDIVQDAMLKLARGYAQRPENEWPPLFYRIVQNGIRDWHRRNQVRNRLQRWFGPRDQEQRGDPLEMLADDNDQEPVDQVVTEDAMAALVKALHRLPLRQQQAFLLRAWEGFNVAETAKAMSCSTGSVKTHYSRALSALRKQMQDHRL